MTTTPTAVAPGGPPPPYGTSELRQSCDSPTVHQRQRSLALGGHVAQRGDDLAGLAQPLPLDVDEGGLGDANDGRAERRLRRLESFALGVAALLGAASLLWTRCPLASVSRGWAVPLFLSRPQSLQLPLRKTLSLFVPVLHPAQHIAFDAPAQAFEPHHLPPAGVEVDRVLIGADALPLVAGVGALAVRAHVHAGAGPQLPVRPRLPELFGCVGSRCHPSIGSTAWRNFAVTATHRAPCARAASGTRKRTCELAQTSGLEAAPPGRQAESRRRRPTELGQAGRPATARRRRRRAWLQGGGAAVERRRRPELAELSTTGPTGLSESPRSLRPAAMG